jgi:RNA-directed DNA polymerase
VREAAQRDKGLRFTTLLHHVNEKLLLGSFYLLKKQAAPGVDRVTWGEYREQPSRRVYIPKPDGRQRPLGIAAVEDKIVQQAVVEVLNQIYEGTSPVSRMDSGRGAARTMRWIRSRRES